MKSPGVRRLFRPKDLSEFAHLRALRGKQINLVSEGLSLATISRLERGHRVTEATAVALHEKLAPDRPFEAIFEVASQHDKPLVFTWEQVSRAATRVGNKVFKEFRPDILITFAGPPSLFTSLVMTKSLTLEQFLRTTIFTTMPRDKRRPPTRFDRKGFDIVDSHRFFLRVPKAIAQVRGRATKRVTIIDDTVATGSAMDRLKEYLTEHGYR